MSYLFDTNICIALLKGEDLPLVERIKSQPPSLFMLCSVVKAELLYGARKSARVEANLSLFERFFTQFQSVPFDDKAAEFYGITRAILTQAGTPIGANDLLIASIAQTHDLTLLSRNHREFSRVPGLRIETW
jgi:tRNA(fMet)-specific endonuclease VapC